MVERAAIRAIRLHPTGRLTYANKPHRLAMRVKHAAQMLPLLFPSKINNASGSQKLGWDETCVIFSANWPDPSGLPAFGRLPVDLDVVTARPGFDHIVPVRADGVARYTWCKHEFRVRKSA